MNHHNVPLSLEVMRILAEMDIGPETPEMAAMRLEADRAWKQEAMYAMMDLEEELSKSSE